MTGVVPLSPCLSPGEKSRTTIYKTPRRLFDELDREFGFVLDVCALPENALCTRYFTPEEDGLSRDWGDGACYMNPPYGRAIGLWMAKAYDASRAGATVVCLLPARTDTGWFHDFALKGEVRYLRKRLKFEGENRNAPFPSIVVVFRPISATPAEVDKTARFGVVS